jgi:excisionase family DNA binding protein
VTTLADTAARVARSLTVAETAARIGKSATVVQRAVQAGELSATRIGGRLYFEPADVDRWAAARWNGQP